MNVGRRVFEFLKMGSQAHAQWDYEVSMSILKNRKRLLVLLALLLPICVVSFLEAGDMIGSKTAYAPAFYSTNIFLVSILIGLCAGLITGCIGAGGGFVITPALMAAGVKGILAVGTDLFHIFAKAIMGTAVHKKLGNVSVKLAVAFLVGSGGGTFIGGYINKSLMTMIRLSELFISLVYAVLLVLGFYALIDFIARKSNTRSARQQVTRQDSQTVQKGRSPHDHLRRGLRSAAGRSQAPWRWAALSGSWLRSGVGGALSRSRCCLRAGVSSMTTVGTTFCRSSSTGLAAIPQYAIYSMSSHFAGNAWFAYRHPGRRATTMWLGCQYRLHAVSILAGFINRAATLLRGLWVET
jgi:uncharacterized membrane protein YfcA